VVLKAKFAVLPFTSEQILKEYFMQQKTILIAGDTPRWHQSVRESLPDTCTLHTCLMTADVYTILTDDVTKVDLCIFANKIGGQNDGLSLIKELQEPDDPPVILFTREITDTDKHHAETLGAVVVDMHDIAGLKHAIQTLLKA
jgi:DNA-binding response OmpR family regulator